MGTQQKISQVLQEPLLLLHMSTIIQIIARQEAILIYPKNSLLICFLFFGKKEIIEQFDLDPSSNLAGTCCLISSSNKKIWIVDSGTTDHMCNDINNFTNVRFLRNYNHEITIPDGSEHKVDKIRDVKLNNAIVLKMFCLFLNFILISYLFIDYA